MICQPCSNGTHEVCESRNHDYKSCPCLHRTGPNHVIREPGK